MCLFVQLSVMLSIYIPPGRETYTSATVNSMPLLNVEQKSVNLLILLCHFSRRPDHPKSKFNTVLYIFVALVANDVKIIAVGLVAFEQIIFE